MSQKGRINCFTISKSQLSPGIPVDMLQKFSTNFDYLALPPTPVCRFAVEDKFNKLDTKANKYWLVPSDTLYYYRFFEDKNNEYVYLLIHLDEKNPISKYFLKKHSKNVLVNEKNTLLLKVLSNSSLQISNMLKIEIKNSNIYIS